jgi:hypothetical protein
MRGEKHQRQMLGYDQSNDVLEYSSQSNKQIIKYLKIVSDEQ